MLKCVRGISGTRKVRMLTERSSPGSKKIFDACELSRNRPCEHIEALSCASEPSRAMLYPIIKSKGPALSIPLKYTILSTRTSTLSSPAYPYWIKKVIVTIKFISTLVKVLL
mmetsp:Transcript_30036/g.33551  ORF Transcript_30036/g.33551 Transcript_30036/m.33551 type:complete len:112 (-) Transcript_30036:46-381(-)